MSGIKERIAAVLRNHQFRWASHDSIGAEAHCRCGLRPWDHIEWSDHVASVLVAELGLTEEEGADFTIGGQAADFTFGGQTRYVTPWMDDA